MVFTETGKTTHLANVFCFYHSIHSDAAETNTTTGSDPLVEVMPAPLLVGSSFYNVIYDTVELEPYFWAVDRIQSEEMLRGTPDGSCLVRPFKMKVGYLHEECFETEKNVT